MDVEVNAHGRYVKMSNVESTEPQEIVDMAFSLWSSTEADPKEISGTGFTITERADRPHGFAFTEYGERPEVK